MKKSNKRQYFDLDEDKACEKDCYEYEHIKEFNNFKKKKIDNQINGITMILDKFDIADKNNNYINNLTDKNIQNNNINVDTNVNINIDIDDINDDDILKCEDCKNISNKNIILKNKIKEIENLKFIIIFDKYFTYDSLILLVNYLVKKYGEEKVIEEKITNSEFENLIWEHIGLMLYPSFLFDPYTFDLNFNNNYVDLRIDSLNDICYESKCFFPTWKKIYNHDIDYNFDDMCLHQKKICKNFTKKIFGFYELFFETYFNIIFGEILSFILIDYKIIINPFDLKFDLNIFNKWVLSFNLVLDIIRNFIKKIANSIQLEKIDELNQTELTNLLNKLKKDFIDEFETISKKDIITLFEPLKEFYKKNENFVTWKLYNSNCLENINREILQLFKCKQYLNILLKNKWIRKFIY